MEPYLSSWKSSCDPRLHPAFGLDEDWNLLTTGYCAHRETLHPAFGLDEDWNNELADRIAKLEKLHPAFGLDEDWNHQRLHSS